MKSQVANKQKADMLCGSILMKQNIAMLGSQI